MSNLRETIEVQAQRFAAGIVDALRGASLEELMSVAGGIALPAVARPAGPSPRPSGSKGRPSDPKRSAGPSPRPAGQRSRLARRSADDIAGTLEKIVALLGQHPEGLRAEQIKEQLGLDKKEVPRPLAEGLSSGQLSKTGNKRATTYFVGKRKK